MFETVFRPKKGHENLAQGFNLVLTLGFVHNLWAGIKHRSMV
jgi:hypothetical protein